MDYKDFKLLYLAPHDYKGGASRIAWYLHTSMLNQGIDSHFAVGVKSRQDEGITQIEHTRYRSNILFWGPKRWVNLQLGIENNYFPGTRHIPNIPPSPRNLIHAHNLQGKYFDLRALPSISAKIPFLLTLHDEWLFTGHCAVSIECSKWKKGCGKCPDLKRPPAIRRDATAFNWKRKSAILKKSKLFIVTPSQWLMSRLQSSIVLPAVKEAKVINNGVDQNIFIPKDKKAVRRELGLPENAFILLYVVSSRLSQNPYKDYQTITNVLHELSPYITEGKKIVYLGIGEESHDNYLGRILVKGVSYQSDLYSLAKYYQAADVYIHAAKAENFPNVILEALSCGIPVIGTDVGGISEQIIEGKTGHVVPAKDAKAIAIHLLSMINNPEKIEKMSKCAYEDAKLKYSLDLMVNRYLDFYNEILS